MTNATLWPRSSSDRARVELSQRLGARREEIEHAVLTRVYAVSNPGEALDPQYVEGLRAAISAAVGYGLTVIELGENRSPSLPPILLGQARLAARNEIGLDTVLRRYFAGHALLGDFLLEEAEKSGMGGPVLQGLLRTQALLFDRLLVAVSAEHARETSERSSSTEQRRLDQVERLLAGELIDTSSFAYDFEGFHHLGAVAFGPGAEEAARELVSSLDRRLLAVRHDKDTVWMWLGGSGPLDPDVLLQRISAGWPARARLAIGEPAKGLGGWRSTHRQARAALLVALRGSEAAVRYADTALLTSILQDDLLEMSLRRLYLDPLEQGRDGGETLRETLRAYFVARRNISSTAAALQVNRQTITNRLHTAEQLLGCHIDAHAAEIEIVLRLDRLDASLSLNPAGLLT